MLKKFFPLSYRANSVGSLILYIIIYAILPTVVGIVTGILSAILSGILSAIPLIGWIPGIVTSLIGLYCTVGLVLAILVFLKVLK